MILVDAHVHIHPCYDPGEFLDAAAANFRAAAAGCCPGQPHQDVLCLTEDACADGYVRLRKAAGAAAGMRGWAVNATREAQSLQAAHPQRGTLYLLAGRQIRCREGIEVLALGTVRSFTDGIEAAAVIDQVLAAGAVAVLPWGFGKWTGRRGRLVRRLMAARPGGKFFLGDNSGRPAFGREPALFALARRTGFRILPGTDPLPFAAEVSRVAAYGFAVAGRLGEDEPARDLQDVLADPRARIMSYGRRERPLRFLRNQLAMQWMKRRTAVAGS